MDTRTTTSPSSTPDRDPATGSRTLLHLWEMIEGIRFGMLAHRGDSGGLHAHPLTTLNRARDADRDAEALFFFIPKDGEIYQRLQRDPQVVVTYADPSKDRYVSVSGRATWIEDLERKKDLWSAATQAWFPQGPQDPNVALLAVQIEDAEYWDVQESKMVQLWKMARAVLKGEPPQDMGEHAKPPVGRPV